MKDPVDPSDLEKLTDNELNTIEDVLTKELHNLAQVREKLRQSMADIKQERVRRKK